MGDGRSFRLAFVKAAGDFICRDNSLAFGFMQLSEREHLSREGVQAIGIGCVSPAPAAGGTHLSLDRLPQLGPPSSRRVDQVVGLSEEVVLAVVLLDRPK